MKIGSFSLIKELNTSIILNTIRKNKNISRAEIATITGLTPATVTNLTSRLLDNRLITETKLGESNGGRKPVILEINSSEYNVACVTIGKHQSLISLFDLAGNLIKSESIEINGISCEKVLDQICEKLNFLKESSPKRTLGVGVSCEGLVNAEDGILVFSANIGWEDVAIRDIISEKTGIPVFVDNDVKVIALGEKWFGAAKEAKDFILFYTGFGIGIAVMTDDRLFRGSLNYAGEFGHITVDADGPVCSCGNKGCLQLFASASALIRELKEINFYRGEEPSLDELLLKAVNGDKVLNRVFEKQAYYIGVGAASAINVFNPSVLIFNGYICRLGQGIKDIITEQIDRRCLKSMKSNVKIVYSQLNSEAVNKGAAALVISNLFEYPSLFFGDRYEA